MRAANINDAYVDKIRADRLPDVVSNIISDSKLMSGQPAVYKTVFNVLMILTLLYHIRTLEPQSETITL